jgi:hypothetical protein
LGPADVALGCGLVVLTHALAWIRMKAGKLFVICLVAIGFTGGVGCSLDSLERSITKRPSDPFPVTSTIQSSPMWLAPVKNSTGQRLLLPSANPLDSVREMMGKRSPDERDSVMKLLRVSTNLELSRRGITVSEPESVDKRLSRFPGTVQNAVETARQAGMSGNLFIADIKRWDATRTFVNVLIDVRLINIQAGAVIWEKRIHGAIPTPAAVSLRDGYVDGVKGVVRELFPPA